MFTIGKSRKLQYIKRINLSVFTVNLAKFTAIHHFHKLNSSRHNNIMSFEIRYYNANSLQRRYRIRH